jgi:extracellular factor (EF) 3-hydroxypalmitic acid methyl ester biosynthesis protein
MRDAFGKACQVYISSTLENALERIKQHAVSAVLINLETPGVRAKEAIHAIHTQCGHHITIMGYTPAHSAETTVVAQTSLSADGLHVIQMPMDWRGMRGLLGVNLHELDSKQLTQTLTGPIQEARTFSIISPPTVVKAEQLDAPAVPALPVQTPQQEQAKTVLLSHKAPPQAPATTRAPVPAQGADLEEEPYTPSTFLRDDAIALEEANRFVAQLGDEELHGRILRVTNHYIVCEMLDPQHLLLPDWTAEQVTVFLGPKEAYRGPAKLSKIINTGNSLLSEWVLLGRWHEPELEVSPQAHLEQPLASFFNRQRVLSKVSAVFKAMIAEMASLLEEVKQCMDRIESSLSAGPAPVREAALQKILPQLQPQVFGALNDVFGRFEKMAAEIPVELAAEYHSLVRQYLHPLLMCSPFVHHIYSKPLGFAGDYGALKKLLGDRYEGRTLYAKLVNAWIVSTSAGEAYRKRVQVLIDELQDQSLVCHERGQVLRTLSIGCGAGNEVVAFLKNEELSNNADMTLVDFNDPTLAHCKERVTRTQREYWRLTRIRWVKQGIQGVIADETRMRRKGLTTHGPVVKAAAYDFISCTGLLDYFSDRVCKRLIQVLWNMLAPGGKLVICNFTSSNPIIGFMDYVLDWKLIYRDAESFRKLLPEDVKAEQCRIEHSLDQVEVYFIVTKAQ